MTRANLTRFVALALSIVLNEITTQWNGNYGDTLPIALFPSCTRLTTCLDFQKFSFQASRTT